MLELTVRVSPARCVESAMSDLAARSAAADQGSAHAATRRNFALVLPTVLGLFVGAIAGLIIGLVTGLIPFAC
jgi:hypothetical protein